jgi:hypothetical protein
MKLLAENFFFCKFDLYPNNHFTHGLPMENNRIIYDNNKKAMKTRESCLHGFFIKFMNRIETREIPSSYSNLVTFYNNIYLKSFFIHFNAFGLFG